MVIEQQILPYLSGDRRSFYAVCWGTGHTAGPAEPPAHAPCWTEDGGKIWARIHRRPAGSLRLGLRLPPCNGWRAWISAPARRKTRNMLATLTRIRVAPNAMWEQTEKNFKDVCMISLCALGALHNMRKQNDIKVVITIWNITTNQCAFCRWETGTGWYRFNYNSTRGNCFCRGLLKALPQWTRGHLDLYSNLLSILKIVARWFSLYAHIEASVLPSDLRVPGLA